MARPVGIRAGCVERRDATDDKPPGWWGKFGGLDDKLPWIWLGSFPNSRQGRERALETIAALQERALEKQAADRQQTLAQIAKILGGIQNQESLGKVDISNFAVLNGVVLTMDEFPKLMGRTAQHLKRSAERIIKRRVR